VHFAQARRRTAPGPCIGAGTAGFVSEHRQALQKAEVDGYRTLIGRRGQRIPVAYLTGVREFLFPTHRGNQGCSHPQA